MGKIAMVIARKKALIDEEKEQESKKEQVRIQTKSQVKRNTHLLGTKIEEAQKSKQQRLKQKTEQESQIDKFQRDLDTLHGLSLKDKALRKIELISKYREYCEAFIKEGSERQDRVFQHWVVWLFDAGLVERKYLDEFLIKVKEAIRLQQKPVFLKSTFEEFLHWSMLRWAEEEYAGNRSPEPWFSKVCEDVKDWEKLQHQLSRRMLTLWFKLLQDSGEFKKASEVGKTAIEFKAKIKGRYNEVLNQLN